jgi:hypothetical protein
MGKGGDSCQSASVNSEIQGANEVIYDGRYYDTTTLRHPGGSIIKFYSGKEIDCTEAFDNFHVRSKKAKKMMDLLPSRAMNIKLKNKESIKGQNALLDDYNKLTQELHNEGLFNPDPVHVLFRCLEIIVMHGNYILLIFIFNFHSLIFNNYYILLNPIYIYIQLLDFGFYLVVQINMVSLRSTMLLLV